MAYRLSQTSLSRLDGVHPDLVRVVKHAITITQIDFMVLEGLRTIARQRQLVKQGASQTLRSKHLTGHAVDLVPFIDTDGDGDSEISWHWPHYHKLAPFIKQAAKECEVALSWGGDWRSFKDGPHWELDPKRYPFP
ncbi:M15 family metallopeptidase [Sphingomonas sp. S1-29]|uniref:M15 family metallopeptidase n=1 Tax=Sphingomonas sp. S1-29 TaxID=2991074 RepID=UPI00223FABBB|nr:M15 family metallopeptidase [Sphingomonas sp. S1-29]UZK70790.1 M15 family metallopeptidase [Sphingomonas sp. S1-29]